MRFRRALPSRASGFTLVITLLILTVVTILVVGLFGMADSEKQTASSFDAVEQADLAIKAGLAQASAVLEEVTRTEDAVIFAKPMLDDIADPVAGDSWDSAEKRYPKEYLMAARYRPDVAMWQYIPLVSGMLPPVMTSKLTMDTDGNEIPDEPVPNVQHSQEDLDDLARAPYWPEYKIPQGRVPVRFWETLILPSATEGGEDQIAARFCFAIEDLQGALSLQSAGNLDGSVASGPPGSNEVTHLHARPEMKIVNPAAGVTDKDARVIVPGLSLPPPDHDPRVPWTQPLLDGIALYTLIDSAATEDGPAILDDNRLVSTRLLQISAMSWKQVLLNPSVAGGSDQKQAWAGVPASYFDRNPNTSRIYHPAGRRLEEATVASHVPYYERALIPHFEGIAGAGEAKLNLNKLIEELEAEREQFGLDSEEALNKQEEILNEIADHINVHIPDRPEAPGFARGRRGGYWMGGDEARKDSDGDGLWDPPAKPPTEEEKDKAYLKCLAAGIIDYADKDSLPTMRLGHYRGTDSYPLVNEQWQRYRFIKPGSTIQVGITDYLELWNPTNQKVKGEIQIGFDCRGVLVVGAFTHLIGDALLGRNGGSVLTGKPFKEERKSGHPPEWWHQSQTVELQPNEIKVVQTPEIVFSLLASSSSQVSASSCTYQGEKSETDYLSRYRLRFKPFGATAFNLVDEPPSIANWDLALAGGPITGIERRQRGFSESSPIIFSATAPGMNYGVLADPRRFRNNLGDTRASFFVYYPQDTITFWDIAEKESGTSPWTRNFRRNIDKNPFHKETRIMFWPDGGHVTPFASGSKSGLADYRNNKTLENNPFDAQPSPRPLLEPEKFVQVIANRGNKATPDTPSRSERLYSVTELGHVFDPIMWDPDGGDEGSTPSYLDFADIGIGAKPSTGFCGGNTLRIGRVEHSRFRPDFSDTPLPGRPVDRRLCATVLLDLFHCGVPHGDTEAERRGALIKIEGHVNINTAHRETLRALVAGKLVMDSKTALRTMDTALAELHPPQEKQKAPVSTDGQSRQADLIADAIIRHRPYASTAEVPERVTVPPAKIGMTGAVDVPVFGNTKRSGLQANSTVFEPEWNDAAAEEVFARFFNSSTVRSRNFRVVVTGQAIRRTPSGRTQIMATRSKVYHVFVRPERDPATGVVINQKVEITYARSL